MGKRVATEEFIHNHYLEIVKERDSFGVNAAVRKFKISSAAVYSALIIVNRYAECPPSYLKRRGYCAEAGEKKVGFFIPQNLTWEQVIQTVPDKTTLAFLLVDGFTDRIGKLDTALKQSEEKAKKWETKYNLLLEDRKRLMIEYNNYVSQQRTGGKFTLDQTQHILIPKER